MDYIGKVTDNDVDVMQRIEDDLLSFRNKSLSFGRETAKLRETQLKPVSWWEKYGHCAPTLVITNSSIFLLQFIISNLVMNHDPLNFFLHS